MDRCTSLTPRPASTRTPTRIGDGNTSSPPVIGPLIRAPAKHAATTSTPAPSTKPLPRPFTRRESASGQCAYVPTQLRHSSPATEHRHSHHPGPAGTHGRQHHHDRHPRLAARWPRSHEPTGRSHHRVLTPSRSRSSSASPRWSDEGKRPGTALFRLAIPRSGHPAQPASSVSEQTEPGEDRRSTVRMPDAAGSQ